MGDRRRAGLGAAAERLSVAVHRCVLWADLRESVAHRVVVDGRPILLTRIDDTPHAIADVCPHNGAVLSEGVLRDGCVTCPSHLWRFSVVDGTKQGGPEVRVAVYPARVTDDGWVEVDLPASTPQRSLRETLLAHARGEAVD